ncbi:MAG: hypothetical protein IKM20_00735 [Erysipelotrichales bacterium]|nr:hypothetical protein [Erysipelotrichales bacterium]
MPFIIIKDQVEAGNVDGIVSERVSNSMMPVGNSRFQENKYSDSHRYELLLLTRHNDTTNDEELYTYYQKMLLEAKTLELEKLLIFPQAYSVEMAKKAIKEFLQDNELMIYMVCREPISEKPKNANLELSKYLEQHYSPPIYRPISIDYGPTNAPCMTQASIPTKSISLSDALNQMDESFSEMLLRFIDESGMSDAECYKKANIDRKLFSKIRGDRFYRPSKITVLSFAIALELSLDETNDMLKSAGYALSHSNKFDVIIEFFISQGNYDVYEINEALFEYDQALLGV